MEWGWNDQMVPEWQASKNSNFSSPPKSSSFILIWSFLGQFRMPGVVKNENYNREMSFTGHPSHSHFILSLKNDDGMTEWGKMNGYFWSKAKPLIYKFTSFHFHSVISCQYPIHGKIIHVILPSFLSFHHHSLWTNLRSYSNLIQFSFSHFTNTPFIQAWNDGLRGRQRDQLYAYSNLIQFSFHNHSCHSCMEWWSKREADESTLRLFKSHSILIFLISQSFLSIVHGMMV